MRGPYLPDLHRRAVFHPSAAAVVHDTMICVSSMDAGTACAFNTAKGEWRQAGGWVLPCDGVAEYAPELGLWFGVEHANRNPDHCLRAFDLSFTLQLQPHNQQQPRKRMRRSAWYYQRPRAAATVYPVPASSSR